MKIIDYIFFILNLYFNLDINNIENEIPIWFITHLLKLYLNQLFILLFSYFYTYFIMPRSHNTNVEKTPSRRCKSKEAPETNNLALQISDNVKGNLNELQDFYQWWNSVADVKVSTRKKIQISFSHKLVGTEKNVHRNGKTWRTYISNVPNACILLW